MSTAMQILVIALVGVGLIVGGGALGRFIGWFASCHREGLPFNWSVLGGYDRYQAWLRRQGIDPFPRLHRERSVR